MSMQETEQRTKREEEEARKQSDMWIAAIEQGLQEVQDLREKLEPVAFASGLWEEYRGAYGDIREDVAFLFCPEELVPKTPKLRRLDPAEKGDYEITFDNLSENLTHQLSFYDGTYLAMPYLVLLLEKKRRAKDYEWEKKIICTAGDVLATDIPYCRGSEETGLPEEVQKSYEKSVDVLQEMTKDFLEQNMERLKGEDPGWLQYFCTDLMAILGDREAAFQMLIGQWEQCPVSCPECGYYDEEMEADGFYDKEQLKKIVPAESVIGQWDRKSYEDTYVWFSNLTHDLGVEDAWKVPYYYGTYTCPECGSKGILLEWMKETDE